VRQSWTGIRKKSTLSSYTLNYNAKFASQSGRQTTYLIWYVSRASICNLDLHKVTHRIANLFYKQHIQETHDSYFQTALERAIHPLQYKQHPAKRIDILSLRCLEESCQETFETEESRYAHLVSVHEYPEWFRFNHQTEKRHDSTKTRRRDGQKNKRQSKSNSSVEKKLERKQRQKDKRASIPCRYFAQGHCRYSDKCMFLHESRDDMDIDDLVQQVKTKARVSVPDKISFGRRHRG